MARSVRTAAAMALVIALAAVAGCSRPAALEQSRQAFGTAIDIRVLAGADTEGARIALDRAFSSVAGVDRSLSSYDESSPIAAFNRDPYVAQKLPADAVAIIDRIGALEVTPTFSPALFGVTRLYDFGGKGSVPSSRSLDVALAYARTFTMSPSGEARFVNLAAGTTSYPSAPEAPGLDFGGASKGLAMDRAAAALRGYPALITAGSSTLAFGSKPDAEPWRVGIEDPRDVGRVVAVVAAEGTLSVSTSGDYQTFFERDGTRYHHILDPATGVPARGMRSLTVFGSMSGLDADILSTALFVMGRDGALAYAKVHGVGVYLVDAEGKPDFYVPPDFPVGLELKAAPTP